MVKLPIIGTQSINFSSQNRLTVANKEGVFPYPPFLPHSPVFPKSSEFREFLLQKCKHFSPGAFLPTTLVINAERTAMWSKEFCGKMEVARRVTLLDMCERFGNSV